MLLLALICLPLGANTHVMNDTRLRACGGHKYDAMTSFRSGYESHITVLGPGEEKCVSLNGYCTFDGIQRIAIEE